MTTIEILKIIAPIIGGFLGVGGIGAYYAYKASLPTNTAGANKINADVVVTFAEGWRQYAEKLESRLEKNEQEVARLKEAIAEQDTRYGLIIKEKDNEIAELQEHNRTLELRIDDLEKEMGNYRRLETKTEVAREDLHKSVDESIDTLK